MHDCAGLCGIPPGRRGGIASGSRTDRNKASLLLLRTTESRDQEIIHSLRSAAMEPLIARVSWTDVPGRSAAFLVNIGWVGFRRNFVDGTDTFKGVS
jgi:hypothetical protein